MNIIQLNDPNFKEDIMNKIKLEELPKKVCIYDKLKHDIYKLVEL